MKIRNILKNGFNEMTRIFIFYLLIALAYIGLSLAIGQIGAGLIYVLMTLVFLPGVVIEFHDSRLENRKPVISKMFTVNGRVIEAFAYSLLFVFLWTFVFIIPGIIKEYQYFRIPIIARDKPNWTNKEILAESKRQMEGKKGNLFLARFIIGLPLIIFILGFAVAHIGPFEEFMNEAIPYTYEIELSMDFFTRVAPLGFLALGIGLILSVLTAAYSFAVDNYVQTEITKERSVFYDTKLDSQDGVVESIEPSGW